MATLRAIALRRAEVVERLNRVQTRLSEELGIQFVPQVVTNRDPELAQIQQLENVAAALEAVEEKVLPGGTDAKGTETGGGDTDPEGGDSGEGTGGEELPELDPKVVAALAKHGIEPGATASMSDGEITDLKGIGPAMLDKIRTSYPVTAPADDTES